jgi:hypothetical protein
VSTQLSPQIRVFALVGVLLVVLAGGGLFYVHHRSQPATVTVPATHATTPASTVSTTATSTVGSTTTTATTATTATTSHHAAAPPVHPVHVDPTLPAPLRAALEQQRTVVVGFYDPQVRVDRIALVEAAAGAAEAHVGFVRVNVLDDRVAGRLTALLPAGDILPDPGILVYRRPGKLVYRFDGYLDRTAIAQAVQVSK